MPNDTRTRLIDEAEKLFAENGFNGTSINDIASQLSISKQALLHHFNSKNKLYAAVLKRAADYLMADLKQHRQEEKEAVDQVVNFFLKLTSPGKKMLRVMVLTSRELLDNQDRATSASTWYMQPWLDELASMVRDAQEEGRLRQHDPLTLIYHLLGAIQYFHISQLTLKHIYGAKQSNEMRKNHNRLITAILNN